MNDIIINNAMRELNDESHYILSCQLRNPQAAVGKLVCFSGRKILKILGVEHIPPSSELDLVIKVEILVDDGVEFFKLYGKKLELV